MRTRFFGPITLVASVLLIGVLTPTSAQAQNPDSPEACREMVVDYQRSVYDSANKTKIGVDLPAMYAGMVKRARECASQFNLNTIDPAKLSELGILYVVADNVSAARQAFKRILNDTTLSTQQRAQTMIAAMEAMRKAHNQDSGAVWAEKYLPSIDSLPDLAMEKFKARGILADFYISRNMDAQMTKITREMLALAKQMTPEQQTEHLGTIAMSYNGLAGLYGSNLFPDSALALLRGAPAEFPAVADSLTPQLKTAIGSYEMIGKKIPMLNADYWVNDSLSLNSDKPTIVMFTAHWCPPCIDAYPAIQKVSAKYKDQGLRTVMVVTLDSIFEGVYMDAAQELLAQKKYYVEKHKFSFPIAIQRNDEAAQASKTPRNIIAFNVMGYPQFFIVDREGIVRAILLGWDLDGNREKSLLTVLRGMP